MNVIKKIIAILLIIGGIGSLIGFFNSLSRYKAPDTIGHLFVIVLVFALAIYLLKPKKK